ncbi:endonuclease [Marinobacter sp.]|uniref:endonuclease n=1 Tax=Marinobacter sp. TaxID=50741 RepID=UPI00384D0D4D
MKGLFGFPVVLLLAFLGPLTVVAQDLPTDPDIVVKEVFWGELKKDGGRTFFCDTPFASKGFMVTQGYIYPLSHAQTVLKCGTASQCEQNAAYRRIASDLFNIIPVQSRIEIWRRNAKYQELGSTGSVKDCGIRASTQFIEPPDHVKGDVARTIAYMARTHDLPLVAPELTLQEWNRQDPPDEREISRHQQIAELQGNENPFVTQPGLMEEP